MGHNFTLQPKVGLVCDLKGKLKAETESAPICETLLLIQVSMNMIIKRGAFCF
jgi:hypothetical protein